MKHIIVFSMIIIFPSIAYYIKYSDMQVKDNSSIIGSKKSGWIKTIDKNEAGQPLFVGADYIYKYIYSNDSNTVNYFEAVYYKQRQDKEMISGQNHLFNQLLDREIKSEKVLVSHGHDCNLEFNEIQVKNNSNQYRTIWTFYQVGGIVTHSKIQAKLLIVWDLLFMKKGSRIVALSLNNIEPGETARRILSQFVLDMFDMQAVCD